MKRWTVSIGFSDLRQCQPHNPMRPCLTCREKTGSGTVEIDAEDPGRAIADVATLFPSQDIQTEWGVVTAAMLFGWSLVSADIVGVKNLPDEPPHRPSGERGRGSRPKAATRGRAAPSRRPRGGSPPRQAGRTAGRGRRSPRA